MSRNREARGVPQFPRNASIMKDLGKLKEMLPRSTSAALSVLEQEANWLGCTGGLPKSESPPIGGYPRLGWGSIRLLRKWVWQAREACATLTGIGERIGNDRSSSDTHPY